MKKHLLCLAFLVAATAGYATSASAQTELEAAKYDVHFHPDGKPHCFDAGNKCIA